MNQHLQDLYLNLEQFSKLRVNLSNKETLERTTLCSVLSHGENYVNCTAKTGDEYKESFCKFRCFVSKLA